MFTTKLKKDLDILLVSDEDYAESPQAVRGFSPLTWLKNSLLRATRWVDFLPPRMGTVLLATYAKNAGLKAALLNNVLASPLNRLRFRRQLRRGPLAVGISTVAIKYPKTAEKIAADIRRYSPGSVIIMGGHGAGYAPEMRKYADITVTGYGENALVRLLAGLKKGVALDDIPGVEKDAAGVRSMRGDAYYEEGKPMLFPDWSVGGSLYKQFPVEGSRGCKYNCSFCTTPNRTRQVFRPPAEVFAEVLSDIREHGATQINFVDASFTTDQAFITEFLSLTAGFRPGFRWTCFSRVDDFTRQPGLPGRMAKAGCQLSYLGVESIHDDILVRMRKGYNRKTIEKAFASLEGLNIHVNFIIGFPGDTAEKVRETVDFIQRASLKEVSITPLYVPPSLFEQARLDPETFCHLKGNYDDSWEHDTMDRAGAVELADWARHRLNRKKLIPIAY
jgi:radical SAM superfamily enzyme YgiQ (UPF0313 family)